MERRSKKKEGGIKGERGLVPTEQFRETMECLDAAIEELERRKGKT